MLSILIGQASRRLLHKATATACIPASCLTSINRRETHWFHCRSIHCSHRRTSATAELPTVQQTNQLVAESRRHTLSVLPLTAILRSLCTATVTSNPVLLQVSLRILSILADPAKRILNPDKNLLLNFFLKKTLYAQFCAGEDALEVRDTISRLKHIGFSGVILGYAKETVPIKDEGKVAAVASHDQVATQNFYTEIETWTNGTLATVALAGPGDCVALKLSGAGRLALFRLSQAAHPPPYLYSAIDTICAAAKERGVRLLFDAEQDALQEGIDRWTMEFARKYNTLSQTATVYGTYQAYKKACPAVLSRHLAEARDNSFTLGVKLVRGAYLGSDPRERFHATKDDTDSCYNGIAAAILTCQWSYILKGDGKFPNTSLILATHNVESVRQARAICDAGGAKSEVAFAQLQGMADEISCELVQAGHWGGPHLQVFKYLPWGTTGECMNYLLRRARENRDAVQRTERDRDVMWAELIRRCKTAIESRFRFLTKRSWPL